jgi:hypothetical protein
MFRAAYHSSSGTLTVFAAYGLHTHVVTGRSHGRNMAQHLAFHPKPYRQQPTIRHRSPI